jgi:hypothetical protein
LYAAHAHEGEVDDLNRDRNRAFNISSGSKR